MNENRISFRVQGSPGEELTLNTLAIKKAALVLRAFRHNLRQQILMFIDARQKATVTEIHIKLGIVQSVASQHLVILRKADFVKTERQGKLIYYTINTQHIKRLNKSVGELLL